MGRSSKRPRQKTLDPKKIAPGYEQTKKKEKDWTYEDILRSKMPRRNY